jgi:peptidyl-prolyl cis-trans isomerase SurA
MKKSCLVIFFFCTVAIPATSQTLFTYGKYKADAGDFLRAYNKNNSVQATAGDKAMREYLDLYINSRLKVRQAYDRGYDTLPQIKSEVLNLRNQIIENYMSDPKAIERLTTEAFERSQKDIHVAHIFISTNTADTSTGRTTLKEVLKRLENKEDFMSVAQQFSDDPSAKENKGDINYITVFTLPYEFESIIYSTAPGTYSKPYQSHAGFHIFKNLGERRALGEIKIQQILLAIPPNTDAAGQNRIARLADSLYERAAAGDDFGKLASAFSNDVISANASGNVPDVKVGQFDAAFEKAIWALPADGSISRPLRTAHGFHIVKRVSLKPVVTNPSDSVNLEELRGRVTSDDRWKTAKDFIYTRVRNKPGVQKPSYNEAALWALSDSLLEFKPAGIGRSMNNQSAILQIGGATFRVSDWITYAQVHRYKSDRSGVKPYSILMDEFINNAMYTYYRDHLEDYNDEFRSQMAEFRDGNLFFEIMQQEVWNKAQADSAALVALYEKNKGQYNWKESAEAVIFFCTDEATAKTLAEQLKNNPADWKNISGAMNEKVVTDSGRYEWTQIPGLEKITPVKGSFTPLTVNAMDNTASFAYIVNVYTQPALRTFNEAKGLVMNDYQNLLEEQWIKNLKKKYPVKVDQKVLGKISK